MVRSAVLTMRVAALLCLPALASASNLELTFGSSIEYDSNVFRVETNETQDVLFRFFPRARLYSGEGDLTYQLDVALPFNQGVTTNRDVSDFDVRVGLRSAWAATDRTQFSLVNNFRYDRNLGRLLDPTAPPDVNNELNRVTTNTVTLGANHAVSPRMVAFGSATHNFFDTEQTNRQDNQTANARGGLRYTLDGKNTVGAFLSFTGQFFEFAPGDMGFNALPASQTYFYNLSALWTYRFDETTTLDVSGGPAVAQTHQDPILGTPAFDDVTVTGFANISLSRRWTPTVSSVLSYRRTQNNASGLGGSTFLDAVAAVVSWQIDPYWEAGTRFDYTHRESVAPLPDPGMTGTNVIDTDRWAASVRLQRRIGRHLVATGRLTYNQQESAMQTRGIGSDFKDVIFILGVRYRFDPISVW